MESRIGTALAAAIFASCAVCTAQASGVELITNGGFETADTSGWTCSISSDANCDASTGFSNTGVYSAFFFDNGGTGTLSQTIATLAGRTYDVSFAAGTNVVSSNVTYEYRVDGGARTQLSFAQELDFDDFATSFVASGTSADITFFATTVNNEGALFVDDVSVMARAAVIPLPAAGWLMLAGLASLAAARRGVA